MSPTRASARVPLLLLASALAFRMLLTLIQSAVFSSGVTRRAGHSVYVAMLDGAWLLDRAWVLLALVALFRLPRTEVWSALLGGGDAGTLRVNLRTATIVAGIVALLDLVRASIWVGALRSAVSRSADARTWFMASAAVQFSFVLVGMSLHAYIGWRILRATGRARGTWLALATQSLAVLNFGVSLWGALVGWSRTDSISYVLLYVSGYGANIGAVALLVWAARVAVPNPVANTASVDSAPSSLMPGWQALARGIDLYLGALVARVVFAGATYVAMLGAQNAVRHGGLQEVQTTVTVTLALGLVASGAAMASVFRMGETPQPNVATASRAALGFMALAFLVECTVAWLTTDALSGSLAAAFRAARVLPVLGAVGAALGIAASTFLLTALAHGARGLSLPDAATRATDARGLLLLGGATATGAMLLAKPLPELALILAIVTLPLLLVVAVQCLRVMLELSRTIRARVGDSDDDLPVSDRQQSNSSDPTRQP